MMMVRVGYLCEMEVILLCDVMWCEFGEVDSMEIVMVYV